MSGIDDARLGQDVYEQLRALCVRAIDRESSKRSLQVTTLVSEAFLRLGSSAEDLDPVAYRALAARVVRNLLVDRARRRRARNDALRVLADGVAGGEDERSLDVLDLHDALAELASLDERQGRVVELRYFGGMTVQEVATHLGVGKRTVEGDWEMARGWLKRKLDGE